MDRKILFLLAALLFSSVLVESKHIKGTFHDKKENWAFLGKFCFDLHGISNITWNIQSSDNNLKMLFYSDQTHSWPEIYSHHKKWTCEELSNSTFIKGQPRVIFNNLTETQPIVDIHTLHFWYIVIADCQSTNGLNFTYDIHFNNPGGHWERELSCEQRGLPALYIVFFVFYLLGVAAHFYGVWVLHRTEYLHPLVRFLSFTVTLELLSVFFLMIHYARYASNGVGSPSLMGLGEVLDMVAQVVLTILIVLIAKGWGLSTSEISQKNFFAILASLLMLGYVVMFIWDNVGRDPASTYYIYDSVPGLFLLLLRLAATVWFAYSLRSSFIQENNPNKRKFYQYFGSIYLFWLLFLPFIVLVAFGIPATHRLITMQAIYTLINFLALGVLAYLFWPTEITKFFEVRRSDTLISENASSSGYDTL